MGSTPLRFVLEIDPGSDPIAGELADGRRTQRFSGWLEFADALRTAMTAEPDPSGALPQVHPGGGR